MELYKAVIIDCIFNELNFSVIDRHKTEAVLNELVFQQSGLVSKESQAKLGELLGATHLLIIDFSRFYISSTKATDMEHHKLIEIKSGKVLANTSFKTIVQVESEINVENKAQNIVNDFANYYNEVLKIRHIETEAINAYKSVIGENYTNDQNLYRALINIVIPGYSNFLQELKKIFPTTKAVQNLHQIYVEGANLLFNHFKEAKIGIETQDSALIFNANEKLNQTTEKMQTYKMKFNSILQKYNIDWIERL